MLIFRSVELTHSTQLGLLQYSRALIYFQFIDNWCPQHLRTTRLLYHFNPNIWHLWAWSSPPIDPLFVGEPTRTSDTLTPYTTRSEWTIPYLWVPSSTSSGASAINPPQFIKNTTKKIQYRESLTIWVEMTRGFSKSNPKTNSRLGTIGLIV